MNTGAYQPFGKIRLRNQEVLFREPQFVVPALYRSTGAHMDSKFHHRRDQGIETNILGKGFQSINTIFFKLEVSVTNGCGSFFILLRNYKPNKVTVCHFAWRAFRVGIDIPAAEHSSTKNSVNDLS